MFIDFMFINYKETSITGKMNWVINSMVVNFKSSNLLFPSVRLLFYLKILEGGIVK
jgi:hypothetical protein